METMLIDLTSLRETIETAIEDLLGEYVFTNVQRTKAIGLDMGGGNYPPKGTTAQGLECILLFRPEVPLRPLLGDAFEETYAVQILLRQWDAQETTLPACARILEAIATSEWTVQANSIRRVLPLEKLGNVETLSITVTQMLLREF